ncbi:MAG: 4-hydroxy-tetrahydrodipicolinate synthase [Clostridiales bacterium]|nr:4-hydroxy-tetrahydrodipicolinate synthase [Clostridiales bacterium]
MSQPIFEGSAVAVVTPFNDSGVDFSKLEQLVEFHIKNGSDAIVICGSTGEASTMPDSEHLATIKCCVDAVAGRVPVIAGTGSNDTAHGIRLSKEAAACGADGLLVVTPYYNKCTPEGLIRHFNAVANAVDVPIVLYNVPSRTNVNISPAVLEKLMPTENIVAIKECNFSQVPEIMNLCGDRYTFYSGEDALAVPIVALGGKGVISVVANIVPGYTSRMIHAYLDGDISTARKMQIDIIPLVKAMFCEVNPIPVKEALNMLGAGVGPCRLPLCEMNAKDHDYVAEVLSQYDTNAIKEFFS